MKMIPFFIGLILVGVLLSVNVKAQSCGASLVADTTLSSDLNCPASNGLTMAVNGITLDCAGFKINGTNTASTIGVFSVAKTGLTLKNCIIINYPTGYFGFANTLSVITNNTINHTDTLGNAIIISSGAGGNNITNNTLSVTGVAQCITDSVGNELIQDNTCDITSGSGGFFLSNPANNKIIGNNITSFNATAGIRISNGNGFDVIDNIITSTKTYAIELINTNNVTLINNTARSIEDTAIRFGDVQNSLIQGNTGFSFGDITYRFENISSNNSIDNNIAHSNTTHGILISFSPDNNISKMRTNLSISGAGKTGAGISLSFSDNIIIEDSNISSKQGQGTLIAQSDDIHIRKTNTTSFGTSFSNENGILMVSSSRLKVNDSILDGGQQAAAFFLDGSLNNTVWNTQFIGNVLDLQVNALTTNTGNIFNNVTIDRKKMQMYGFGGTSNVTVNQAIYANVTDGSNPVSNANVSFYYKNNTVLFNSTTNANGITESVLALDFTLKNNLIFEDHNNYTANATLTGFSTNQVSQNITLKKRFDIILTSLSSCTYSGSGDYIVDCADNCSETNIDLNGNNFIISGNGKFKGNLTNFANRTVTSNILCSVWWSF